MRVRFVCVVVALALSWMIGGPGVRAQEPGLAHAVPPAPARADCPECEKALERLRTAQKDLAEDEASLAAVRKRIQELVESIKAAPGFTDREKTAKAISELNVEVDRARRRVDEDTAAVQRAEFELAECNLACREPNYPEPPTTGNDAAACPKCLDKARTVAHLRHELALLKTFQAGVKAGFKRLDESAERKLHSDLMSTDKTLSGAEHELEACNESCHTSFFTQPKGIITTTAIVLGGVVIGTSGGGDSTVTAPIAAPITAPVTPPTSTTPPGQVPPTQPQPPPPAVGNPQGTHVVTNCSVVDDVAVHDPTLMFCRLVVQMSISVATPGTMGVTAVAPLLPLSGAFSTTAGNFDLSTNGTIVGFPNTSERMTGVIDVNGNLTNTTIVFGANGSLPTGRSITYRITTSRQP